MLSETLKQEYKDLKVKVLEAIDDIVGDNNLTLHRGVIVREHGDENECIIQVNKDLSVDTQYNGDITEAENNLKDYDIEIQLGILEMLEKKEYSID